MAVRRRQIWTQLVGALVREQCGVWAGGQNSVTIFEAKYFVTWGTFIFYHTPSRDQKDVNLKDVGKQLFL